MNKNKRSIFSFNLNELETKLLELGLKKHNATQIFEWIYKKHATSYEQMTNIAKGSIKILESNFDFNSLKVVNKWVDSKDGTTKFLFELGDKQNIETVLMKFNYGYSVCVSSQVGCNMGCKFCASGLLKKIRNLSVDEIVLQYLEVNKYLKNLTKERISHIVVMGIGEPLDNFDNLVNSLKIINNPKGIELGSRHITVSTCGLINKFEDFANELPQVNLAISLHAPNDEIRNKIMPINMAFNVSKLMSAVDQYISKTNRRISFEYILLKNVNDSKECLQALVKLLKGKLCFVNIIPYNSVDEHGFKMSDNAQYFMSELNKNNIICTIRQERGSEIRAACGQLRANYEKTK